MKYGPWDWQAGSCLPIDFYLTHRLVVQVAAARGRPCMRHAWAPASAGGQCGWQLQPLLAVQGTVGRNSPACPALCVSLGDGVWPGWGQQGWTPSPRCHRGLPAEAGAAACATCPQRQGPKHGLPSACCALLGVWGCFHPASPLVSGRWSLALQALRKLRLVFSLCWQVAPGSGCSTVLGRQVSCFQPLCGSSIPCPWGEGNGACLWVSALSCPAPPPGLLGAVGWQRRVHAHARSSDGAGQCRGP